MPSTEPLIIPKTRAIRIGYCFLLLAVPAFIYNVVHRLTGEPINYVGRTAVTLLGAMAFLGIFFGLSILGISVIRSAFRD